MRGPAVLLALGAALCLARRLLQRLRRALPVSTAAGAGGRRGGLAPVAGWPPCRRRARPGLASPLLRG